MNGRPPIHLDDLPADFRDVVAIIGLEPALQLAEAMGGGPIYIPAMDSINRASRDRAIRAAFNGRNLRQLSRSYGLCISRIRSIVGSSRLNSADYNDDRQLKLF